MNTTVAVDVADADLVVVLVEVAAVVDRAVVVVVVRCSLIVHCLIGPSENRRGATR